MDEYIRGHGGADVGWFAYVVILIENGLLGDDARHRSRWIVDFRRSWQPGIIWGVGFNTQDFRV